MNRKAKSFFSGLILVLGVHASSLAGSDRSADISVDYGARLSAESEDALISLQDSLDRITSGSGVKVSNISVDQSLSNDGETGIYNASCTASATVGIPGGTEVTISATAPTCTEAVSMIMDAIDDLLEDLDLLPE